MTARDNPTNTSQVQILLSPSCLTFCFTLEMSRGIALLASSLDLAREKLLKVLLEMFYFTPLAGFREEI
jgi:hypothetical protein